MPASSVGEEISHLQRDKGYPHKRAVAAALNIQRSGKMRGKRHGKRKKHSRH